MEFLQTTVDYLTRIERYDVAVQVCDAVAPHAPKTDTAAMDMIAHMYYKSKQYIKAMHYGELALASAATPEHKRAIRFNLGKIYNFANYPEKAEQMLKMNIMVDPKDVDSRLDYSVALFNKGEKDASEKILRDLLTDGTLDPDDKNYLVVKFNLGVHEIMRGSFKKGVEYLSYGRKLRIWGSYTHDFPIPEWDGKPYPGKRVLIVGEGGIGDEFINARFVKHIRDMGMIPSWASGHKLTSILKRLPFEHVLDYKLYTADISRIKEFDYWTPAMNLPATLQVDTDELWYGPYLSVDQAYAKKWESKIPNRGKMKVGVRWSGNPLYEQDLHRTIPHVDVYNILNNAGFETYSLQRDAGADDVKLCPNMIDLQHEFETFEDTLAALDKLDMIVTSCTSIAHAAAALGKVVYVLVPLQSYYVWAEEKEHSSWYGNNLTILRQTQPRDWEYPLKQLTEIVKNIRRYDADLYV